MDWRSTVRENLPVKPDSDILLYQTEDGQTRVEVQLRDETVWLSQKLMADLFQKDVRTINEHIKNILVEGEQASEATIRKFRIVQIEGKREVARSVDFYNLDIILAVGYRVRSHRGTQFRRWATMKGGQIFIFDKSPPHERTQARSRSIDNRPES